MKNILKFIRATWELPQNILGAIAVKIFNASPYTTYKDAQVYSWNIAGGMSLGKHIFLPFRELDPNTFAVQIHIKHEYGHTLQSKRLGWLYLLVIALPSFLWCWLGKEHRRKTGKTYYDFYTESWADKLAGIDRVQADK